MLRIFMPIVILLMVTGCMSVRVDKYYPAPDNQEKIKQFNHKLNVGIFTATKTEHGALCRLANQVKMPNGLSIEGYIQTALVKELTMAGVYSKDSNIIIEGHLNDTNVSSDIKDAHWTLDLTVSNGRGESFNIVHRREYSASFDGYATCHKGMPKSFEPTVQELINKIVVHPKFDELFGEKSI